MGRDWDTFRMDDRSARWASRSGEAGGFGEIPGGAMLPNYGRRRTTSRCKTCGKRDAFRNPHACDEAGTADWMVEYVDETPVEMRAFQNWCHDWALEAYRVLKPGGHLLAFGGTRTYHRLAVALEDSGFDIRDSLHYIYGTGFPKSLDVSKQIDKSAGEERPDRVVGDYGGNEVFQPTRSPINKGTPVTADAKRWDGWGTALKPAHEPIVLARKPLAGHTLTRNVLEHGTGALNIEASRIGTDAGWSYPNGPRGNTGEGAAFEGRALGRREEPVSADAGRWPSNVLLAHLPECEGNGAGHTDVLCAPGCPVAELNEVSGETNSPTSSHPRSVKRPDESGWAHPGHAVQAYGDAGGAARFFYIAKPRKRERIGGTIRNLHPCLAPDSLIVTERGYREIADVAIGERVLADDGRFRDVIAAFPSHCHGPLYEVEVEQSNLSVRATGNHPFLVWRPERKRRAIIGGEPGWVEASDLRVGDYTMTPLPTAFETADARAPDWWWMVGLWLAEGSFITNGSGTGRYPAFSLADHEDDLVERLRLLFGNVKRYERDGHGITVAAFDPGVADDLERLCGCGARTKVLAPDVFGLDSPRRRALFDGYIAGDGASVRGGLAAKTSSRALAPQLALLGESLGYRTCLYEFEDAKTKRINGREFKANGPYYQLFFNDGERLTRPRFVDVRGQRFSLRRVKRVEKTAYSGEVWNLTVAGAHTFQTAVGMTHNTVKPVELMRYLVRLVTPPGGLVLDPFMGSGSTGCAVMVEGFRFAGIEKDPESFETGLARVSDWAFAHGRGRPVRG